MVKKEDETVKEKFVVKPDMIVVYMLRDCNGYVAGQQVKVPTAMAEDMINNEFAKEA